MPIYDYRCPTCDKEIEVTHPLSELSNPVICEECKVTMVRQVTCTSFRLKGSGWGDDGYSSAKDKASLV